MPELTGDLKCHDLIGFRNGREGRVSVWRLQDPSIEGAEGMIQYEAEARIVFDDGALSL